MGPVDATIASIQSEISSCERQLQHLKAQLAEAEVRAAQSRQRNGDAVSADVPGGDKNSQFLGAAIGGGLPIEWQVELSAVLEQPERQPKRWPLRGDEYRRYGRQLIMPEVALQGQLRLKESAVLIVGVGGLGCPAAAYLAGAGVGTIGLVDGDTVEESNLHRQILHSTSKVGVSKVDSAILYLKSLNPNVRCKPYRERLSPSNALDIFADYDVVLDCTDTPASRYLISDTCVLLGKPLVSASALRTEGQLMVLNKPPRLPGDPAGGPCYRCVFPKPPPAESVVSCGDGGILGPVVGVMGILQALEAIKVITAGLERPRAASSVSPMDVDDGTSLAGSSHTPSKDHAESGASKSSKPCLLLFSAYGSPQFRSFGLRSRKPKCAACSAQATVTREALASGSMDYVQFCGALSPVDALAPEERISAREYYQTRTAEAEHGEAASPDGVVAAIKNHVLVDVREKVQFELAHLDGGINIPFSDIMATPVSPIHNHDARDTQFQDTNEAQAQAEQPAWLSHLQQSVPPEQPIVVTCRLGNDSQLAVRKMKALGLDAGGKRRIVDVKGGLRAWREDVETDFPDY